MQLFITTPPSAIGFIKGNKLRPLALASAKRHPMLSGVPTTAEAGLPGFELDAWFAVFGPAGMPTEIINKLSAEIKKIMSTPEFHAKMEAQGTYGQYLSQTELAAKVQQDLKHWDQVVKTAKISLD